MITPHLGLSLPNRGVLFGATTASEIVELAARAEATGAFGSVWGGDSILAKPREALAIGKDLFYRQREMGVAAAYQLAGQTMAANMMHDCAQEGVTAFTEKRKPNWIKPT